MKHSLVRILRVGWTNLRRNSYMSFAVIGVMSLVLLLVLCLLSFQFVISQAVKETQSKVDISAYFGPDAEESGILEMKSDLEKLPEVAQVTYISREQALEEFKAGYEKKDDKTILEALEQLDSNPLPATLNIRAVDPEKYEAIAKFLENSSYKDHIRNINYYENKEVIDKINSFAGSLKTIGISVSIFLAIIAILVTFNTVRLTIYNQRQEIEIMRLVGASNWHIRGPYIVEGGLYGLIASVFAMIIFYLSLYVLTYHAADRLFSFFANLNLFKYFLLNSWQIAIISILTGIILGVSSSFVAIRRHLRI